MCDLKVSIIMSSYLGYYENCASTNHIIEEILFCINLCHIPNKIDV